MPNDIYIYIQNAKGTQRAPLRKCDEEREGEREEGVAEGGRHRAGTVPTGRGYRVECGVKGMCRGSWSSYLGALM